MAVRGKLRSMARKLRRRKRPQSTRRDGQAAPNGMVPVIRKGIYLSALVYVEGEQAAPEDFAALATSALKEALAETFRERHGGLSMSLKGIEVRNDVEQEDEDSTEERFQF